MSSTVDYDVAIVGAGNVGAAIARELARFELRIALVEAGRDVGAGTSKANTAILHTGYDAKPGTLEARLVARGYHLLTAYAEEVGIPLERTGALLVAWDDGQLDRLRDIRERAADNGYGAARPVDVTELYSREPHLGSGAVGALEIPDEHVVCPFTPVLAFATQAVLAGVELRLNEPVVALECRDRFWRLETSRGSLAATWVVNAAGLHSDEVNRLAGRDEFTVTPRRGELIVFDKLSRPLVRHVLLPVPTEATKGVLVAPTVFGNVVLGPTAVDVESKVDTSSTEEGLAYLREQGRRILPALSTQEVTAVYVGLRAATESADYQLWTDVERRYLCAGGIRSTGLTSSLAIAEHVRDELSDSGRLALRERVGDLPAIRMPPLGEAQLRPFANAGRIDADPEYGRVVCFCERVTLGEIRDAARSALPPGDLDGLRRRTRALMGRCQGFFCGASVAATFAEHAGRPVAELWELDGD